MEKKKLMLISPMLHQGGFERVCVTTARLMEPYFDVTIVIFDSANIAYDVKGLKIIDLNLGVRQGKFRKIINILRRSKKLKRLKRELKPDIAYSFGPTANMVNAFSKTKRTKTKVWLGIRSYMDMNENVKLTLFTRMADLIVCCSKEIEKEVNLRFEFNKTTVLYNPYDVDAILEEAEEKEPTLPWGESDDHKKKLRYLISMGREDDVKGFWHVLKIFALVHEKVPEIRLVILGEGTFEPYKRMAAEFKIADVVYFAGVQREPYKYLKKGDIYLLTSSNEGFPNALVEGMALGLAAISVNCKTGPAEILCGEDSVSLDCRMEKEGNIIYGEYGIILPVMGKKRNLDVGEIEPLERQMAEVVTKLLQDETSLRKYQEAARVRAQMFNHDNYIKNFLSLVDPVADRI